VTHLQRCELGAISIRASISRLRPEASLSWISRAIVLVMAVLPAAILAERAFAIPSPFYMGGDISLETFMQQQNVHFSDNVHGSIVEAPMDRIMYDHGANLFRLRVFVNPETVYSDGGANPNYGAIQTTAFDIALARQIKANCPNAKILLDFHYSDTWADPGKQGKPAAWTNIPVLDPVNHNDLVTKIKTYTQSTLQSFGAAGVMPEMVQVGNEITNGMLWGTGGGANSQGGQLSGGWQNLGRLLNASIEGVRAAQGTGPKIDVAIHIDQGDANGLPQNYFSNLTNPGGGNVTDFDTIGVSYYPSTRADHSLAILQSNLNAIADTYLGKKIMVSEINYPWETSGLEIPDWPATAAGQLQFLTDTQNVVLNLHHGAGAGLIWWFPEAVSLPGYSIYNGGATALFDSSSNHKALPALNAFGITLVAGDYSHNGVVDAGDYTVWRDTLGSTTDLRADGDGNGVVNQLDYAYWANRFAAGASSGAASNGAVPEPPAWLLLVSAMLAAFGGGRAVLSGGLS
jgi:arabinogalactan endo-1,4-beta-galactosidase